MEERKQRLQVVGRGEGNKRGEEEVQMKKKKKKGERGEKERGEK